MSDLPTPTVVIHDAISAKQPRQRAFVAALNAKLSYELYVKYCEFLGTDPLSKDAYDKNAAQYRSVTLGQSS